MLRLLSAQIWGGAELVGVCRSVIDKQHYIHTIDVVEIRLSFVTVLRL